MGKDAGMRSIEVEWRKRQDPADHEDGRGGTVGQLSPDGRRLLYASERNGDWDLFETRIVREGWIRRRTCCNRSIRPKAIASS